MKKWFTNIMKVKKYKNRLIALGIGLGVGACFIAGYKSGYKSAAKIFSEMVVMYF